MTVQFCLFNGAYVETGYGLPYRILSGKELRPKQNIEVVPITLPILIFLPPTLIIFWPLLENGIFKGYRSIFFSL